MSLMTTFWKAEEAKDFPDGKLTDSSLTHRSLPTPTGDQKDFIIRRYVFQTRIMGHLQDKLVSVSINKPKTENK